MEDEAQFLDGGLTLRGKSLDRVLASDQIQVIHACHMEDALHHGDEAFHILLLQHELIVIGPFVRNALGAVEALIQSSPQTPHHQSTVRAIPWRYRQAGFFGLRLFPVPGLVAGPIEDLDKFNLTELDAHHG